jgi:hypothetical protein
MTLFVCALYSAVFLVTLGTRLIRAHMQDQAGGVLTGMLVLFAVLVAVVTAEALLLIHTNREVAGRLLYSASLLGGIVSVLAVAGVTSVSKAIEVALSHRRIASWGLVAGNIAAVGINCAAFLRLNPNLL